MFLFSSERSGAGSRAQGHGSAGQDVTTELLEISLLRCSESWMLVGGPVGAPQGEEFNVKLDQDLPRTMHPTAFSLDLWLG